MPSTVGPMTKSLSFTWLALLPSGQENRIWTPLHMTRKLSTPCFKPGKTGCGASVIAPSRLRTASFTVLFLFACPPLSLPLPLICLLQLSIPLPLPHHPALTHLCLRPILSLPRLPLCCRLLRQSCYPAASFAFRRTLHLICFPLPAPPPLPANRCSSNPPLSFQPHTPHSRLCLLCSLVCCSFAFRTRTGRCSRPFRSFLFLVLALAQ